MIKSSIPENGLVKGLQIDGYISYSNQLAHYSKMAWPMNKR